MPASRWNTNLEMINWFYEDDNALEEIFLRPIVPRVVTSEGDHEGEPSIPDAANSTIPSVIPILPLRGLVVYPQTVVPLTIGQARSRPVGR